MSRPIDAAQIELITRYLDGTLAGADRDAFEQRLAQDADLRSELALQQRVDESLGRMFDDGVQVIRGTDFSSARPAHAATKPVARVRIGWVASVAAGLLLAVALAHYLTLPGNPDLVSPQVIWNKMEARDFKPAWTCKDDQEFAQSVRTRLGQAMLVPGETPGLRVVGWVYCGAYFPSPLSDKTMILITKKDNDHVLLIVDQRSADRRLSVPTGSGLHLFRDTEGSLVLYELTPRSEPVVLPIAKANEPPAPGGP